MLLPQEQNQIQTAFLQHNIQLYSISFMLQSFLLSLFAQEV